MTRTIVKTSAVALPATSEVLREPTRPVEMRGDDFESRFDRHTLCYDAVIEHGRARLICPPLLNLQPTIEKATFTALPSGRRAAPEFLTLDRQTQILLDVPDDTHSIRIQSELGDFSVAIMESMLDLFAGHRAMFTMSKNNRLEWILDWARFHRDIHGVTAILLYDNASTDYSSEDLLQAFEAVGGVEHVVIVEWPFKFGPPGVGKKRYWDSDFAKLGATEDARWRFLNKARSVLNCDIDELVLSSTGESIFDRVEASRFGVISFFGDWVFGIEGVTPPRSPDRAPRFYDYRHVLREIRETKHGVLPHYPMRCQPKWAAVPDRVPTRAQWHFHKIGGWWPSRLASRSFRFRHFREISTNWKYDRLSREPLDLTRQREDALMTEAFARVNWNG